MTNFDYTSRDYDTIRNDLLDRAAWRIPSWTTRDASDFGMVLVELWAYMGDILHYYVDRAAGEAFLDTATQRESVVAIANLLDYTPNERVAATVDMTVSLAPSSPTAVTLPAGAVFIAPATMAGGGDDQVFFTLNDETYIEPGQTLPVILTEGRLFNETLVSASPASLDMILTLPSQGVVPDSIRVFVAEGPPVNGIGEATEVEYVRVNSLLQASYDATVFSVSTGADDTVRLHFGNGVNGKIPTARSRIRVAYRTSVGQRGNVAPGRVTTLAEPIRFLSLGTSSQGYGGKNAESVDSMRFNMPRTFRTNNRAVTVSDVRDLALRYTGVAKAHSVRNPSPTGADLATVTLYATTSIPNYTVTPDPLVYSQPLPELGTDAAYLVDQVLNPEGVYRPRLERDLEERMVIGLGIDLAPNVLYSYVRISIDQLHVKDGYIQFDVRRRVVEALIAAFDFDRVSYGHTVRLGELYSTILSVPGVDYVVLTGTALDEGQGGVITPTLSDKTPGEGRLPRIDTRNIIFEADSVTGGITGSN